MSGKNVTIKVNGEVVTFANTSKVALQVAGSAEIARYTEISDTTASASDVMRGKIFYDSNGTRRTGTHEDSGGGGGREGWPVEAKTVSEMTDAKVSSNNGRLYVWKPDDTSVTTPYTIDALYQIHDDTEEVQ